MKVYFSCIYFCSLLFWCGQQPICAGAGELLVILDRGFYEVEQEARRAHERELSAKQPKPEQQKIVGPLIADIEKATAFLEARRFAKKDFERGQLLYKAALDAGGLHVGSSRFRAGVPPYIVREDPPHYDVWGEERIEAWEKFVKVLDSVMAEKGIRK